MRPVVIRGDARRLPLPDASVDSIVCDPPYALGFMGREWDSFGDTGRGAHARTERAAEVTPTGQGHSTSAGPYLAAGVDSLRSAGKPFQGWCEQWAAEALRVLKPGGHLLAFGGTRTYHRLTCAIEDAGFEIRDSIGCLTWCYAEGFPKSLDVSKAIDAAAGAQREVVGTKRSGLAMNPNLNDDGWRNAGTGEAGKHIAVTAPATEDAARWQGWGTALKPAWEPIVVARKPLAGTVAQTVLAYGTGGINVDGCRVDGAGAESGRVRHGGGSNGVYAQDEWTKANQATMGGPMPAGRWPTNLVLVHHPDCSDRCVPGCHVAELDGQSGIGRGGGAVTAHRRAGPSGGGFTSAPAPQFDGYADSGGASRFYPQFRFEAKADTWERPVIVRDGRSIQHPTVKPVDLLRWLVRLVTPPGGTVLDMFAGTGPVGQAAALEGFRSILVELDPDHCALILERLSWPVRIDPDGKFQRIRPKRTDPEQWDLMSIDADDEVPPGVDHHGPQEHVDRLTLLHFSEGTA